MHRHCATVIIRTSFTRRCAICKGIVWRCWWWFDRFAAEQATEKAFDNSEHHKYSSTLRTISRIWNGRPFTFEKGTASTKYFARIIVANWPRFISGIITVSNPARTAPRFFGKGLRWRRCAAETLFPSPCNRSTAELIDPYVEPQP